MMIVKEITRFEDEPTEWAGITLDGRIIHMKYKWGIFGITIGDSHADLDIGGHDDSIMTTVGMMELTKHIFNWEKLK